MVDGRLLRLVVANSQQTIDVQLYSHDCSDAFHWLRTLERHWSGTHDEHEQYDHTVSEPPHTDTPKTTVTHHFFCLFILHHKKVLFAFKTSKKHKKKLGVPIEQKPSSHHHDNNLYALSPCSEASHCLLDTCRSPEASDTDVTDELCWRSSTTPSPERSPKVRCP
jgi:hypothetical protein